MMKYFSYILPILFVVILIFGCKKKKILDEPKKEQINLPYFGFNAKGTLDVDYQTTYADTYFNQIPTALKNNLVVRVTGGTLSQTTFNNNWTDDNISKWVQLQQRHKLRFVYVVNGNDTPINQKQLLQRWINAGAHFDFIEMMNEYYLVKYALGDTTNEEVTRKVSAQDYIDIILPDFWTQLDGFNLPYYVILAPTATGNLQTYYSDWNNTVIDAIQNKYKSRKLNATLHCYLRGAGTDFDYNQITNLKLRLPATAHLAITEAGVIDDTINYQEAGNAAVAHYKKIITYLGKGDYLLDQILYNGSQNNNTANLSTVFNGVTPKGSLILTFINNGLQ